MAETRTLEERTLAMLESIAATLLEIRDELRLPRKQQEASDARTTAKHTEAIKVAGKRK